MLHCGMVVALGSHAANEPRRSDSPAPGITPGPFPRRLASLINWPGLVPGPFLGGGILAGVRPASPAPIVDGLGRPGSIHYALDQPPSPAQLRAGGSVAEQGP